MQLHPDIEVMHADDAPSSLAQRAREGKFTWVFAGRTLYLVGPRKTLAGHSDEDEHSLLCGSRPFSSCMRVLHSKDVGPMLNVYRQSMGI